MGVDDLWKHCLNGVKSKPAFPFEAAANSRVAIDVSCLLHASICKPKNALLASCAPPYPPMDLIATLEANHQSLIKHNITPHYVFDGCQHRMKAATTSERAEERRKALESLRSFCARGKMMMQF